ncbi:hypothetical protein C1H46_037030 [Malus baccata]|uniref:Uncharacterized protein n=1 Tax=Malus baccata TaxID=106549 RepID=A0A540KTI7_MALBA|nr:hypothetical protein C1H46_037030 [Malus baccata]
MRKGAFPASFPRKKMSIPRYITNVLQKSISTKYAGACVMGQEEKNLVAY